MKSKLLGVLVASLFSLPVWADGSGHGQSSGSSYGGGTPTSSSSSSATGGAGGAGGTATGGAATGGNATNTVSGVSGGKAIGNSVSVNVSTGSGGATGASATGAAAGDPASGTTTGVNYSGDYTVKTAPNLVAPSLTTTLSDTCMGSSSFGLSVVGFGATGGTTMVDQACVRRLDSREFRAMGMNDVALALLCQSPANKKAVESTGRSCPSATKETDASQPAAASNNSGNDSERYTDPVIRRRLGLDPLTEASAKQTN